MDMSRCLEDKKRILMIFTSFCAGVSTVLLVLAVASEHWLNSIELYKGKTSDLYFLPANSSGPVYISMNFGIWRACHEYIDKSKQVLKESECQVISSKNGNGGENEEEEDSIQAAIIENCHKSIIFPLLSMCIEIMADILCLVGYFFGRRKYLTFITGVLFVVSGMSLLVGCILFMGTVTGESNHQPEVAKDETPIFSYTYGSSFIMLSLSFCLDVISGVLSVYLFIIRHKESVKRKHAKLRAFTSKADHIQRFLRRKSRNLSASSNPSNGDISRRSSYMPIAPELTPSQYNMNRDSSHMTMLTTLESHNYLSAAAAAAIQNNNHKNCTSADIEINGKSTTGLLNNRRIPEIKLNSDCDTPGSKDRSPHVSSSEMALPPPPLEFQTNEVDDDDEDVFPPFPCPPYSSIINESHDTTRCKTTSV